MRIFLRTERMSLRRFTESDVDKLVELDSDPEVMRYLNDGRPTPRSEVENRILPLYFGYYARYEGFGWWAAIEEASGEFLGWFEFRPHEGDEPGDVELGYRLRKRFWGKGYATEGGRALIHRGFTELGVRRVYAQTMAVNRGSRRVLEKCGLRFVRTFHEDWAEPIEGSEHGEVEYALTRAEWARQEKP
ncbi:GNAT family N-acetyltransferase [Amycolatopsis anabasis]|uniref:GNAT family N-acetyltransferase n=1 Tax=Amycolatopsis anabasis TaxID=1840409 RepID=UPI00131D6F8C|nr:GNAT family N-acetyltransferase [Amycolatopsis anabasis]